MKNNYTKKSSKPKSRSNRANYLNDYSREQLLTAFPNTKIKGSHIKYNLKDKLNLIEKLVIKNFSEPEIAKKLKVSPYTLHNFLREYNLKAIDGRIKKNTMKN